TKSTCANDCLGVGPGTHDDRGDPPLERRPFDTQEIFLDEVRTGRELVDLERSEKRGQRRIPSQQLRLHLSCAVREDAHQGEVLIPRWSDPRELEEQLLGMRIEAHQNQVDLPGPQQTCERGERTSCVELPGSECRDAERPQPKTLAERYFRDTFE